MNKKYLVDTNIIINALYDDKKSLNFLNENVNEIIISYITFAEVIQGARNKEELRKLNTMLSNFEINYSSTEIGKNALNFLNLHLLNNGLKILDAIIASTAIELGLILKTLNLKHFRFIEKLSIEDI